MHRYNDKVRKMIMAQELEYSRSISEDWAMKSRLKVIPFNGVGWLFNSDRHVPCYYFGRQLVLKIVDELLDTGE